ncbi:uncharacterized protein LOC111396396 isoform X1 [Olea europaea var. sylvestris]|uniref:uncharacterized protein LOC111396396 isoform X1 n=1 Tax=Olea europaea var. sylvestris TaxID=158386 RepID=UPI000C1D3278|nr:uncharacterized protein LOC111396396 isoform X1 [Olea europaea var. sylvestris]XP_022878611.1 uncharacterized protein LOC111396396 isoform X1 [Olea europaea var. sylvestris]
MSSTKSEFANEAVYSLSNLVQDCKPCEFNLSHLDVLADTKQLGQKYGHEKCFFHKQVNVLDAEISLCAGYADGNMKLDVENQLIEDYCSSYSKSDAGFCSDQPLKNCLSHVKNDQDHWMQKLDPIINDNLPKTPVSKNTEEFQLDLDSHWIGFENVEPWWHMAGKDEVASMVSQWSFQHINNSDVLKTPSKHFGKGAANCVNCFNQIKEQNPDEMTKESDVAEYAGGNLASTSADELLEPKGSDGTFSSNDSSSAAKVDKLDTQEQASADLSRAQLLEALCHSQTRARDAERLAQEACDEKEHIIDLLFRQASYLFAYRQWLQILQLETVCLQLRKKNLPNSTSFLPRVKRKGRILRTHKQSCNISKCAVAFAVGLSLAGAGLLVGWTIGWLFSVR